MQGDVKEWVLKLQQRIKELVASISSGMFEREEIVAVSLLGALCGQNIFLYGPPGTAKSLISRRIACAFEQPAYFEYLMNRFSTPEEVFGPVSIKALKEDRYIRKTDSYLPRADFAFLDEIWKSSPAILNTLLTLINERIYRNGEVIEQAPLKALVAASNEIPEPNQGLEALYDRFVIRLMVGPISEADHFDRLLNSKPADANIDIPAEIRVTSSEWAEWMQQLHQVVLSKETLTIIHLVREQLEQQYEQLKVYVSDRRWQRTAILLKASAFFNGRQQTNHSDALLLGHCLWTHEDNRQAVAEIVAGAIQDCGLDSGVDLASLDTEKDDLDREIEQELHYKSAVYKTEILGGKEYFYNKGTFRQPEVRASDEPYQVYIPLDRIGTKGRFYPVDRFGRQIANIQCEFDEQGFCWLERVGANYKYGKVKIKPEVLFYKGSRKNDVNERVLSLYSGLVMDIKNKLQQALEQVEEKLEGYESELDSPFVSPDKSRLAVTGILKQVNGLRERIKDCERLEELCR